MKVLRTLLVGGLFFSMSATLFGQDSQGSQANAPGGANMAVLVVDAGPCNADFVVRDESGKGVYDAKITLKTSYGFMGLHRLDLNVGTNAEGKARIEGLPDKPRKAADFKVAQGGREKMVAYDPVGHCNALHEVTLEGAVENKSN
jgi:hypothetical protein